MAAPHVCLVVGARPNFMKVAPVHRALGEIAPELELVLVHTGQHYDSEMSAVFIDELELPHPDVFLGVGSGSHGEQTARALVGMEGILVDRRPTLVVVAGDVNSTLSAALAASKLGIPVAHIESGLRSFDESMPEEANRRLTDHLSRLLFAHSESALQNLDHEGIDPDRVHLVGNTMIDSVLRYLPRALTREPWIAHDLEPSRYALVTLHRPALVDDPGMLERTIAGLLALADSQPVLFPVHPRTRARIADAGIDTGLLRLCAPLGYLDFLGLEARAAFVLTDSGGVQEETSTLGVRCFTLRNSTERPVTVELGTNTVLGADPDRIASIGELLEQDRTAREIPLWDGRAGDRVAERIAEFVSVV
jgi:UDP-N-acetylglucosamine 2-epimerase (non-hydrolysing)